MRQILSVLLGLALVCPAPAQAAKYGEYILAPSSRTVYPVAVYGIEGTVSRAEDLVNGQDGTATLWGPSAVTLDFGKNIAGIVSVTAGYASSPHAAIRLAYSESSLWINSAACDATADVGLDAPLSLHVVQAPGTYTVDRDHERGAFRYLSLFSTSNATIQLTRVSVYFTAAPTQDL